jgi:hypothetical protein
LIYIVTSVLLLPPSRIETSTFFPALPSLLTHETVADEWIRRPTPAPDCRSGFTTLPPVPLLEQYRCGSFVGGAQITEELAIREYSGHEDLRGSGRWSVIPYVHG